MIITGIILQKTETELMFGMDLQFINFSIENFEQFSGGSKETISSYLLLLNDSINNADSVYVFRTHNHLMSDNSTVLWCKENLISEYDKINIECKKCDYATTYVNHTYTAVDGANNTKTLKCECGHQGLTVNIATPIKESPLNIKLLFLFESEEIGTLNLMAIDLTQFAEGVSAKTISFDGKNTTVTVENTTAKVNVADIVAENTTL